MLGGPESFDRGVGATYVQMFAPEGRLADLARQAAVVQLQVPIDADYPFAEAPRAVAHYAGDHIRGKVVISF